MPGPSGNILDQALATVDALGLDPNQTREGAIRRLEAAGYNLQPGTVIRDLVDATYAAPVQVGDQVRIGEDEYTVTSVTPRGHRMIIPSETQLEQRLAAHYAPGGEALKYNATTRIRFRARERDPLREEFEANYCMNKMEKSENKNFSKSEAVKNFLDGKTSFPMLIDDSKVYVDNLKEAWERNARGYRSVWWWLRNPIV